MERCVKCDYAKARHRCPVCDTYYCDYCADELDGRCPDCGEELEPVERS